MNYCLSLVAYVLLMNYYLLPTYLLLVNQHLLLTNYLEVLELWPGFPLAGNYWVPPGKVYLGT